MKLTLYSVRWVSQTGMIKKNTHEATLKSLNNMYGSARPTRAYV